MKSNFENIKEEYEDKKRQLDREKVNLECVIKKERLSELFKEIYPVTYKANKVLHEGVKCDKCDDSRMISFTSPTGNIYKERCECWDKKYIYEVSEELLVEFRPKDTGHYGKSIYYKLKENNRYGDFLRIADGIFYDEDETGCNAHKILNGDCVGFEELLPHRTFFKNKSAAQLYCDYLNNKDDN